MRYQAALHPDCPIHREKITANQALTKVFYNDYEFKSRKPTLINKYNYNNNLTIVAQYSPLLPKNRNRIINRTFIGAILRLFVWIVQIGGCEGRWISMNICALFIIRIVNLLWNISLSSRSQSFSVFYNSRAFRCVVTSIVIRVLNPHPFELS